MEKQMPTEEQIATEEQWEPEEEQIPSNEEQIPSPDGEPETRRRPTYSGSAPSNEETVEWTLDEEEMQSNDEQIPSPDATVEWSLDEEEMQSNEEQIPSNEEQIPSPDGEPETRRRPTYSGSAPSNEEQIASNEEHIPKPPTTDFLIDEVEWSVAMLRMGPWPVVLRDHFGQYDDGLRGMPRFTSVADRPSRRQLERVWGPTVFEGLDKLLKNTTSTKHGRYHFACRTRNFIGAVFARHCSPAEYKTTPMGSETSMWWPIILVDIGNGWAMVWCQDQLISGARPWQCRVERLVTYGPLAWM
jgi:hypothetical protein